MATTESLLTHYQQHRSITPKTRVKADVATSTVTTVAPISERAPDTSLASVSHDQYLRILTREERNPTTPSAKLTNRNLLVSRRLALKRQRAAIKGPSLHYAPIRSEAFQLELGNADDIQTSDDRHTIASPSVSNQRLRPISTHTAPFRGETPRTAPADISLMYRSVRREVVRREFRIIRSFREKPTYSHPITGRFLVKYSEDTGNPSPCAYVLPRKPCRERNAPAYTFGTRCLVEKSKFHALNQTNESLSLALE